MYKKVLILTSLLFINISILAMDMNETSVIIEEATNATKSIQDDFSKLINEKDIPVIKEINEISEIEGSVKRGLILFKTKFKTPCNMTGEEFAKNYTQEDWDDIYEENEFKEEIIELCPKIEKQYKDEWTPHLYQFSVKYASDSDEIPEC